MENILFKHWVRAYHGPFTKKEANEIAEELKKGTAIGAVKVRARSILKGEYDVYIK